MFIPRLTPDEQAAALPAPERSPRPCPLTAAEKALLFGRFAYVPDPTASDHEAIRLTDTWPTRNIVSVGLTGLAGVTGAPESCRIPWHRLAVGQLLDLWAEWERAGLLPLVLSWGGSWCPRFVRGSRTTLSSHAWGTAFDLNVAWNQQGRPPAAAGSKGSVLELVPAAERLGFAWGGRFQRSDGMHFEVAELRR